MELTIGMATYDDFEGVYFTVQALRLYQDIEDTEILVVDNYGCEMTKTFVEDWTPARYVLANEVQGTGPAKNRVFEEAQGTAVVACDSHVLLAPGVIGRLRKFYRDHPDCDDLLQGPLLYDDLVSLSTHFAPEWRTSMWGTWATDPRGLSVDTEPFEIPMQGLGAFSCRKSAWLGFSPRFRGFGGEEGYIHEKFRQAGRRTLCLPWFLWTHRFVRSRGVPYTNTLEDRLHNYIVGHAELGLDLVPIVNHFAESLPEETVARVVAGALWEDFDREARASHEERGVTLQSALAAPSDGNAGPAGGGAAGKARVPTGRPPAVDAENRAAVGADPGSERRSPAMSGGYPAVSCICPTYGRPELLEEAIQSFLLQDYQGPKELIVLNDFDRQFLMFDHPEVTIINLPRRFRTLGEKHNAAVALASHDLIFVWDDDDIYLPHRLTFSVERFDVRKGFFRPGRAWLWNDGRLSGPEANLFAAGSCWSRELFERVRNYAPMGLGHDVEMEARFEEVAPGSTRSYDISSEDIYYVYRWGGTGTYHGSGFGQDQHRAVGEYVHQQVRLGLLQTGQIALAPRWKVDYVELVREHLIGLR